MPTMTITREIQAPVNVVFNTVAHTEEWVKCQPQVVKVEYLTDQQVGVGAKFRETRMMKGKEATTELEVTEYEVNDRTRLVADSHGAVWDSLFTMTEQDGVTTLTLTMESRPYKLIPKIMLPLCNGMIKKEVAKDMDRVKAYCEEQPA